MMADGDSVAQIISDAIEARRADPDTPRCSIKGCERPSMWNRPTVTINGEDYTLCVCDDHDSGIDWASKGYVPNIIKTTKGIDMRTGERRD